MNCRHLKSKRFPSKKIGETRIKCPCGLDVIVRCNHDTIDKRKVSKGFYRNECDDCGYFSSVMKCNHSKKIEQFDNKFQLESWDESTYGELVCELCNCIFVGISCEHKNLKNKYENDGYYEDKCERCDSTVCDDNSY